MARPVQFGGEDSGNRVQLIARIVECRFFAGMTIGETADALGLSPATVKRGWSMARAWLHRAMHPDDDAP